MSETNEEVFAEVHTWMDEDDMESAKVTVPSSPQGWERLAVEKPCGCWCMKKHRAQPPAAGTAGGGQPTASDLGSVETQKGNTE